jgi:hypothetical protein
MVRRIVARFSTIAFFLIAAVPGSSMAADCTSGLYKSLKFKEESSRFSPYEKVFIKTTCTGLAAGEYVMHVNWVHHRRGLLRSDKHEFGMDIEGRRVVFFWFKLSQKGPF